MRQGGTGLVDLGDLVGALAGHVVEEPESPLQHAPLLPLPPLGGRPGLPEIRRSTHCRGAIWQHGQGPMMCIAPLHCI